MEENEKVLDRIRDIIYRKREEALAVAQQNPEILETVEAAIAFINIPQCMRKIDMRRAFLLFNYCGFPKEE